MLDVLGFSLLHFTCCLDPHTLLYMFLVGFFFTFAARMHSCTYLSGCGMAIIADWLIAFTIQY